MKAEILDDLHHVAVQVPDIAAAVSWYEDKFRCAVDYQDATWAMLRFANTRLALVLPDQHPPHFAVTRADAESFGTLTGHRDGSRSIYVEDPSGNAVEVIETESLPAELK